MEFIYLIIGLVLLVFSGKYLVFGSVQIAQRLRLSSMIVGLTVVAFGTSAPELIVSVSAAFDGHADIAIGNVVGSNIANIALILGLTAMVFPIVVKSKTILRDWIVMFLLSVVFIAFTLNDTFGRLEAFILFALLVGYVYYSVIKSRSEHNSEEAELRSIKTTYAILIIIASCIGLSYGAKLLVKGAAEIAHSLGITEKTISVTIVAFGTSVPELTASLVAAYKKEMDISIGNIIGSNIFNIGAVLGITGMICPITIEDFFSSYSIDMIAMLLTAVILLLLLLPLQKGVLTRAKGGFMFILYVAYIYVLMAGIQIF